MGVSCIFNFFQSIRLKPFLTAVLVCIFLTTKETGCIFNVYRPFGVFCKVPFAQISFGLISFYSCVTVLDSFWMTHLCPTWSRVLLHLVWGLCLTLSGMVFFCCVVEFLDLVELIIWGREALFNSLRDAPIAQVHKDILPYY